LVGKDEVSQDQDRQGERSVMIYNLPVFAGSLKVTRTVESEVQGKHILGSENFYLISIEAAV
jgi:hypothetical protein